MQMRKISDNRIDELKQITDKARNLMVEALICAGCGHPGGAFSCIDLLVALYFEIMNIDPKNPSRKDRDRFILSKGHSSVALYTTLHLAGFIDLKTLLSFRQDDSLLCGHPDASKVAGVEANTGSLGHGLSIGVGLALAGKMNNYFHRVFVLMGDGETQEGSIWEAAMSASHYKLDNLVGIIDRNKIQIDGPTEKIMALEPYKNKWEAFGWRAREINGHNLQEIIMALKAAPFEKGKPSLIIANTVKGKGVSFMENTHEWHGKALKGEYAEIARRETKTLN